jgi:plastocyanin
MKYLKRNAILVVCANVFAVALFLLTSPAVRAQQNWKAKVGAQSADKSKQASAFLPNELWIHAGDTITWTFASDDIHTVSFLMVGQIYPFDFAQGCPPVSASGSSFDGSTCVSSAPSTIGQTYAVTFPKAGNYEIVCLVHSQMFGLIHVVDSSAALPYDQAFYDQAAQEEEVALFEDRDPQQRHDAHHAHSMDRMKMMSAQVISHTAPVTAGIGEIAATPADSSRFRSCGFSKGRGNSCGRYRGVDELGPSRRTHDHFWN